MKNTLYKNVVKYFEQAEQFIAQGNSKDAEKRLKYAEQFTQKLMKLGFQKEMQPFQEKIDKLKASLNGPTEIASKEATPKTHAPPFSGAVMSRTEFRAAVDRITKLEAQFNRIFSFYPALSNLNDQYKKDVNSFNKSALLKEIENLRTQPEAAKPYHRSLVKMLDRASNLFQDMSAAIDASAVAHNLDQSFQYLESGAKGQSTFVFENTQAYINLLFKLAPNNSMLLQKRKGLQQAKSSLAQKEAAEAKAASKGTAQDRSLPVRGLRDASLEKEFKALARKSVPSEYEIVDVIITSQSWGINKDALGRPLNRAMIAYMVERDRQGKCYVQYFAYSQPAIGGGYGRTQVDLDWSSKSRREVDCP